jgi:hypothetical protein
MQVRATSHTRLRPRDQYIHFKQSHWWRRRSPSKFASHYAWGTNGVSMWMQDGCKSLHGLLHDIKCIMFHGHSDYFYKPPLGSRPNTNPGDHGTPNTHNHWFILFHQVSWPIWIEFHSNYIWLRARSHMTSHCTRASVWPHYMISEVCWDGLWTLSFGLSQTSWSRLLARVWSGLRIYASIGKPCIYILLISLVPRTYSIPLPKKYSLVSS